MKSAGGYLSRVPQVAFMLPSQIKVCRDMRKGVVCGRTDDDGEPEKSAVDRFYSAV